MKTNYLIKVDFPKISEINSILEIQELVLLKNNISKEKHISEEGFIVNKISYEDIHNSIEQNKKSYFIIVARNDTNKIIGYFFGYDMEYFIKNNPNWLKETNTNYQIVKNKKVLYGKHIATNRSIKGIGQTLSKELFTIAKNEGYDLFFAEICEGPIRNNRSLNTFVNKFSMKKISEYKDSNDFVWGIYSKEI